jgi:hypothetical protein
MAHTPEIDSSNFLNCKSESSTNFKGSIRIRNVGGCNSVIFYGYPWDVTWTSVLHGWLVEKLRKSSIFTSRWKCSARRLTEEWTQVRSTPWPRGWKHKITGPTCWCHASMRQWTWRHRLIRFIFCSSHSFLPWSIAFLPLSESQMMELSEKIEKNNASKIFDVTSNK